jgi:hypothetical protein
MQYTVKKCQYIPHTETFTTMSGNVATINNANGGKYAVLIQRKDGKIATGTGYSRANATRVAYLKCLAIFPITS